MRRGTGQRKSAGMRRKQRGRIGAGHPSGNPMIDLHYAPTPNGWKISIMLEELGLPYTVFPVNIRAGDQFKPEFLAISPNNRIPAIVDHAPADGGGPFSVFETGAILIYLADKTGRFLPKDMRGALQRHAVADVADERARSDARPARPFRALCAGENPLRHRALPRRGGAALSRARYPTGQDRRLCRRRRIRSPTSPAFPGP